MSAAEMFEGLAMACVERLRSRLELEHGWAPSAAAVRRIKVGPSAQVGGLCEVESGDRGELLARAADPKDAGRVALAVRRRGLVAKVMDGGVVAVRCQEGDRKRAGQRAQAWAEPALAELRKARRAAIDAHSDGRWERGSPEGRELAAKVALYEEAARAMVKGAKLK